VEIVPATPDRWAEVERLLGGDGEGGCWCQPWRARDPQAEGESRPDRLRRQMAGAVPPGFLAIDDGEPVGWVGVSARQLVRARKLKPVDEQPVWAIGCFRVRPGHRRQGIARALLDGVIAAARAAGAPGVEAWPVDPQGKRIDVTAGYVGLASMFDAAGFRRVRVTEATSARLPRIVVRLDLTG
jgi:GNAT superfamily N-acetyltransferase